MRLRQGNTVEFSSVGSPLRVHHDLAQHGVEEPRVSAGNASRLDVDITTCQRPRTLDVQRRAKYGVVKARNVAAHILLELLRVVFCSSGGRLCGRLLALLWSASSRPRSALRIVDEDRDAFQIHHRVTITKSYSTSRTGNI